MQASDWQGSVGERWARSWRQTDLTFAPIDRALVDLVAARLAIVSAPRVLDIGCGAGATALSIVAAVADAKVVGIDLSPALIAAASARDAAARCRFEVGDAGSWRDGDAFDLLVSRHGVMFFDDPISAFAHLRTLGRPMAPLVFSCFRAVTLNPWASEPLGLLRDPPPPSPPETPGPFAFADRDRVAGLLAAAGWQGAEATPLDYDYVVGEGEDPVRDACDFFLAIGPAAAAAGALDAAGLARFRDALSTLLERHRIGDRIVFSAAAWLWSARA